MIKAKQIAADMLSVTGNGDPGQLNWSLAKCIERAVVLHGEDDITRAGLVTIIVSWEIANEGSDTLPYYGV